MNPVIDKIKKLLNLSHGNQNENERFESMKLAQDLLDKHNLSMADLIERKQFQVEEKTFYDIKVNPWIKVIIPAACKLYNTDCILAPYGSNGWVPCIIGTKENIEVTKDVASFLIASVNRESKRLYRDEYLRKSFRLGAAQAIYKKASELVKPQPTPDSTGTQLMIIKNALTKANEDYKMSLNLRSARAPRRKFVDGQAFASGSAYGNSINLSTNSKRISG